MVGCNSANYKKAIKPEKLVSDYFTIDITKDTTLKTTKGAVITIPAGAISSSNTQVQIEIKEAYSMSDMIAAGLTTQSNGNALSSGGMIYFNFKEGVTATIKSKISIATPAPYINPNMQLYRGAADSLGNLNWINPSSIEMSKQTNFLNEGKQLFIANCSTCHSIEKKLTGPQLVHPLSREHKEILYKYIGNPVLVSANDNYYKCLMKEYPTVMTSFPTLHKEDVDKVLQYVETESYLKGIPMPPHNDVKRNCLDSCEQYQFLKDSLNNRISELKEKTVNQVERKINSNQTTQQNSNQIINSNTPEVVRAGDYKSLYYQFTIETTGWYNVDILLKDFDGFKNSELMVRLTGEYRERVNIYLIIPQYKVLVTGGLLKDKKDEYGFYESNGNIPLPMDVTCYILAVSEQKEQIAFALKEFKATEKQNFDLQLQIVSQETFTSQIKLLNANDLSIGVKQTETGKEIKKTEATLNAIEKLKPVNCDCDCINFQRNDSSAKTSYVEEVSNMK